VAQERLCDPSFEDCRTPLLNLIKNETLGIDVAFWFMEDSRYATELIRRHQAGVPIRVIIDPRANSMYPVNAQMLADLSAAGIPMRRKLFDGFMHMKMMMFVGQNQLEFSGANYSPHAFKPETPFVDYVDEAIYFTDDPNVINSFKTKYDDLWTDTVEYGNYANISGPLVRNYPTFPIDPELNFPPQNSFAQRSLNRYNAETQKIDVIMFRITDSRHPDAMIAAKNRGVPVRLITEPDQYRNPDYVWHSYNVDRMYMAGIPIKQTKHLGLNHQKTTILYGQTMSIFGSSNWTGASSSAQQEHNYFTKKSWIFNWFVNQFERKWNSTSEFEPFVPQPPSRPDNRLPADQALGQPTSVTLTWEGGPWSHRYDVYLGTDPNNLQLIATDIRTGDPDRNLRETYALTGLSAGTTYYWKVRGKTMAQLGKDGLVWSFTTAFLDVPQSHPFYTEISKLSARGVTLGCGGGNYCPALVVTRGQMAAFIIRALGMSNPPQPAQQRFLDVPRSNPFYAFIEQMAVRQITTGCGGGNYCPNLPVTRGQMAAFIIRSLGEFTPPLPASQRYLDVPHANPFYRFIDRMAVLGITQGCGGRNYCPNLPVTRGQMAAFLVRAFNL
jgi:phosphatidylserine/phosphatidylglycerophosphate/cardiolipin synthase-like enzyme